MGLRWKLESYRAFLLAGNEGMETKMELALLPGALLNPKP